MKRHYRFKRWMRGPHPGNITPACRRIIVRAINHGLIVTSTTDGGHARTSYHYTRPGSAVDLGLEPRLIGTAEGRERMVRFQRDLLRRGAGKFNELFGPDNWANVKNGVRISLTEGTALESAHDSHVHVAPRVILPLPIPRKGPASGIDISSHQGTVDYAAVKAAGYRFVWVKASEGQDFNDPLFLLNVRNAKRVGLKVGAYHYIRARPGRSGAVEARFFNERLNAAGLGRGDLRPVLDVEDTELNPAATAQYAAQAITELRHLTGVRPVFYTYPAFNAGLWPSTFADTADLWLAHYTAGRPTIPKPWNSYVAWQFSSSGRVPGVAGRCDVNTAGDLRKLIA